MYVSSLLSRRGSLMLDSCSRLTTGLTTGGASDKGEWNLTAW